MQRDDLEVLEKNIGYTFGSRPLLSLALTHRSWANEHRSRHGDNERLEFLGDAILDFIAAEFLYGKYSDQSEGEMSRMRASMVSEKPLAARARDLDVPDFLLLGKGEEMTGGRGRDSIISDAMEAIIGAVYLDGGFDSVRKLVREHILSDLHREDLFRDRKTPLQEFYQDRKQQVVYSVIGEEGPDHDKRFTVEARVDGQVIGTGTGRTKKAAAQAAAEEAMRRQQGAVPGQGTANSE